MVQLWIRLVCVCVCVIKCRIRINNSKLSTVCMSLPYFVHVLVVRIALWMWIHVCTGVMVAESIFPLLLDKGMANPSMEVRAIRYVLLGEIVQLRLLLSSVVLM